MSNTPNFMEDPLDNWYKEYSRLVHYHIKERLSKCSEEEIEDRTSEVFRRVARWLKNGGEPIEIKNPKAWLMQIATNVCKDYGRENTRKSEVISIHYVTPEGEERSHLDDVECSDDDRPEIVAEKRELVEKAFQYLRELPSSQRKAIELRYLKEWVLEQIAREMKKSRSTVRKDINKGMKQLRERLLDEDW